MLRLVGLAISALIVGGVTESTAQTQETVQSMLAAQIRTQGFVCDKALGAVKDTRRSKPDHPVWVLKCSNASYRVSRVPDLAAKVEVVR
jgi:hypothetical protein